MSRQNCCFDPRLSISKLYPILNYLETRSSEENNKYISTFENPDACQNSHAIAILTEWDEFKEYDWQKKIYDTMLKPAFVFDGRNLLDADK
jgi:UDPglucose 6-dehydrogenase